MTNSREAPRTTFDPSELASARDPYQRLAELRRNGPVQRAATAWLVLGHAAVEQVLRSPASRSGFVAEVYRSILPEGAARDELGLRINFLDPPDHTRVRQLVSKAFTPRRIAGLRPFVARLSREILARFVGAGELDLYADFAHQVPALVISELLGVPAEDRDRLIRLSDGVAKLLGVGNMTEERLQTGCAAAEEMHAYLRALLAKRRVDPRDDLLSALLAAEEDRQRLSEGELLSLAATLYSAGHRTTSDLFTNGTAVLLTMPDIVADLRRGAVAIASVVWEYLRFETPTFYVVRMSAEPIEVDGVSIPAREPILLMLAAANRDPDAYTDADRFDPYRWEGSPEPPPPLSFALGPHYCLGANLARLEAEEMLRALLEVMPRARPATENLRWRHTGLFRGLEEYRVLCG
jgi:cytochrome P450